MPVEIINFHQGHLKKLSIREPECVDFNQLTKVDTPTYTMCAGDDIICCFGILPMWNHVAEIWSITGDNVEEYKFGFHKASVHAIKSFWNYYKLKRLQATCQTNNDQSYRWLERLGFETEGIMKNYGPNCGEYYIMAKVSK